MQFGRTVFQRLNLDAAFDFPAHGGGGDDFAQAAFQMAQVVGHFELHVQIAVVYRADVEVDAFAAAFAGRIGKTGHTVNRHVFTPFLVTSESRGQYNTSAVL